MEPRRNIDIINDAMKKGQQLYPDLCFVKRSSDEGELLEVTQSFALQIPQANYVSVARILFYPSGRELILTYDVQILFTSIQSGEVNDLQQVVEVCAMITRGSEYKFCPGLDEKQYYEDYHSPIGYHLKSVRLWDKPFKRIICAIVCCGTRWQRMHR